MTKPWLAFLLGLAACGGDEGGTIEKFEGTASIGGKPATVTSCRPARLADGDVKYVALELGLDTGHTVIVDGYAGMKIRKGGETTKLSDCSQLKSHSSSGQAGSKAWATGEVGLTCPHADGELVIEGTYDCGSTSRPSNRVDRDKK